MNKNKNQNPHPAAETAAYSEHELHLAELVLHKIEGGMDVFKAIRKHPLPGGAGFLSKHALITAYRQGVAKGSRKEDGELFKKIRLKPMRTLSGVTT